MRIAVVAPSNRVEADIPNRVHALARDRYGEHAPDIVFHSQCFQSSGHFAGPDAVREAALVEVANDPRYDAVWLGRGGYGANRIAGGALVQMTDVARRKAFLGYSDGGFLLAGLLRLGVGHPVHAPMASDVARDGGEAAVARSLDWLIAWKTGTLDFYWGSVPAVAPGPKVAAFNLTVFASLLGTPLEPDLTGRILMLEEVGEAMYRIDRMFYQVTSTPSVQRCAGIMLGRCAPIPPNDPPFGIDEAAVAQHWCAASGIPWLGRADIGHDSDNQVVPFG